MLCSGVSQELAADVELWSVNNKEQLLISLSWKVQMMLHFAVI